MKKPLKDGGRSRPANDAEREMLVQLMASIVPEVAYFWGLLAERFFHVEGNRVVLPGRDLPIITSIATMLLDNRLSDEELAAVLKVREAAAKKAGRKDEVRELRQRIVILQKRISAAKEGVR